MQLPEFNFHCPRHLRDALELKQASGPRARFLAGGTDLLVHLKKGLTTADSLIDLSRIQDLARITREKEFLFIGACATMAAISSHAIVRQRFPALRSGCENLGSHLIRNRATIGGNACNASPAGDTLCPLLVYKAAACLESLMGKRQVPIEDFFEGPGRTTIRDDEILMGFKLPLFPDHSGAHYIQLGKRKSSEINVVNVASFLEVEPGTGKVIKARIALGSVAPTPIRSFLAEKVLIGRTAEDGLFYKAGETARQKDCRPIDDFRGSAGYRRAMVGVLTKRTLSAALEQAMNSYPR